MKKRVTKKAHHRGVNHTYAMTVEQMEDHQMDLRIAALAGAAAGLFAGFAVFAPSRYRHRVFNSPMSNAALRKITKMMGRASQEKPSDNIDAVFSDDQGPSGKRRKKKGKTGSGLPF